jgi:hypothetical protein
MLKEAREGIVRGIVRIAIHDQPYLQVLYSPLDNQEKIFEARIGIESTYPGLAEGDRVVIHSLMNVVTKIAPSGDKDD